MTMALAKRRGGKNGTAIHTGSSSTPCTVVCMYTDLSGTVQHGTSTAGWGGLVDFWFGFWHASRCWLSSISKRAAAKTGLAHRIYLTALETGSSDVPQLLFKVYDPTSRDRLGFETQRFIRAHPPPIWAYSGKRPLSNWFYVRPLSFW